MKRFVLLDLDGVLITTPSWKADPLHEDGYSDFNLQAVANLNELLSRAHAELWLSSSRRIAKSLTGFNEVFANRGIQSRIQGFLPVNLSESSRKVEIESFLHNQPSSNVLILDDDKSLHALPPKLKNFWIQTDQMFGFDRPKLFEAIQKLEEWEK